MRRNIENRWVDNYLVDWLRFNLPSIRPFNTDPQTPEEFARLEPVTGKRANPLRG